MLSWVPGSKVDDDGIYRVENADEAARKSVGRIPWVSMFAVR